jgi:nucleotide-binding universal stress UspA family protein
MVLPKRQPPILHRLPQIATQAVHARSYCADQNAVADCVTGYANAQLVDDSDRLVVDDEPGLTGYLPRSMCRSAPQMAAGTVVKVVSVEEPMVFDNQMAATSLSAVYPASLLEELAEAAHDRSSSAVQTAKEILVRAGMQVKSDPGAPVGEPRGVILDAAKFWQADMIVLGSHGRRGLERLLLDSVSEAVAIYPHCSVEVIRSA